MCLWQAMPALQNLQAVLLLNTKLIADFFPQLDLVLEAAVYNRKKIVMLLKLLYPAPSLGPFLRAEILANSEFVLCWPLKKKISVIQ